MWSWEPTYRLNGAEWGRQRKRVNGQAHTSSTVRLAACSHCWRANAQWCWRGGAGNGLLAAATAHSRASQSRLAGLGLCYQQGRPLRGVRIEGPGHDHELRPLRRRQQLQQGAGAQAKIVALFYSSHLPHRHGAQPTRRQPPGCASARCNCCAGWLPEGSHKPQASWGLHLACRKRRPEPTGALLALRMPQATCTVATWSCLTSRRSDSMA